MAKPASVVPAGIRRWRELNGGAPLGWKNNRPTAIPFTPLPTFSSERPVLNAVVSTWFDADIIEACVVNCFEQGCERVFILDNASPDDSVAVALKVGATLGEVYTTEVYDDDLRVAKQNRIVREALAQSRNPDEWWITLDADEFPCGNGGERLIDTLVRLPRNLRALGMNSLDLYPYEDAQYKTAWHPASCMTHGSRRYSGRYCYGTACSHWKHPCLRYFNGVFDLAQSRGSHCPALPQPKPLYEPQGLDLWLFHAPFREEGLTRARLEALCNGRNQWDDHVTKNNGAIKRFNSLEAVYRGHWDRVDIPHTQMYGRSVVGLTPYPWRTLLPSLAHLFGGTTEPKRINLL